MILANLRMLDDVPNDDGNPFTATWRTLVRLDLHQFKACLPSGPTSPGNEMDPLERLASSECDSLESERWAELVARCLNLSSTAIDLPYSHLSEFVDRLSDRITWQRHLGHIDEARRSTGRMHAFAQLLVARYPHSSAAHFALSGAFMQVAKNSWRPHRPSRHRTELDAGDRRGT